LDEAVNAHKTRLGFTVSTSEESQAHGSFNQFRPWVNPVAWLRGRVKLLHDQCFKAKAAASDRVGAEQRIRARGIPSA